jgi:hypothetical protein
VTSHVRDQEPGAYAETLLKIADDPVETGARTRRTRLHAETRYFAAVTADRYLLLYRFLLAKPSGYRRVVYD